MIELPGIPVAMVERLGCGGTVGETLGTAVRLDSAQGFHGTGAYPTAANRYVQRAGLHEVRDQQ